MPEKTHARPAAIRVRAFAKINLTLRVLGRHRDGYHDLRTVFQSLALHDTLTCTAVDGPFAIECDAADVPCDASNLVWRAADALWPHTKRQGPLAGVRVRLRKAIPMQAGLGGGSSDAAAALRALSALWTISPEPGELHEIARQIGADVPYFLVGGTALGVDRGDLLFPLEDQPPSWVVLAMPEFGVSTREAYGWWDDAHAGSHGHLTTAGALLRGLPSGDWRNDLEPPVAGRRPEITAIVAGLHKAGAIHAMMSGSGSAVFGLFDSEPAAEKAASVVAAPRTRVVVTRTLSRARYLRQSSPRSGGR